VAVQGRIRTGSYKNKEGATVYTTEIVADRVEFLDKGDRAERSGDGGFDRGSSHAEQAAPVAPAEPAASRDPEIPEGFTALDDDDDDIPF
jgi:single-strand DNA-binding protein